MSIKIRSGDTLSKIAKQNHVTLDALLKANPQIKDPNKIRVGQEIELPKGWNGQSDFDAGAQVKPAVQTPVAAAPAPTPSAAPASAPVQAAAAPKPSTIDNLFKSFSSWFSGLFGGGSKPATPAPAPAPNTPATTAPATVTPSTPATTGGITAAQLQAAMPGMSAAKAQELLPAVNKAMQEYGIQTKEQKAMFLAQIGHESGSLRTLKENTNYSAAGLRATFPKRFAPTPGKPNAEDYARQPEKIANYVYANRNGNGPESSGDGNRYRGRGALQLTGKANYEAAGKALGLDLVNHPELLEKPDIALRASAWWFKSHGLNEKVANNPGDVLGVTKVINGGTNGLADRESRYQKALQALS
jgi:putative chitinase